MEKIVHQTWKSKELDSERTEWVNSVKRAFSDYEYKFWTDEDNDALVKDSYPEFYSFYKQIPKIDQLDFVRNLYIYHFGGIYMDIDVKMNRPLALEGADVYLCDQTKEANPEQFKVLIDNFFLAGKKGCRFFYAACDSMAKKVIFNLLSSSKVEGKYQKTMYMTGPYMFTKFYLLNKDKYNIKLLVDVISTKGYNFTKDLDDEKFDGIHMQTNTWIDEKDRRR